MQLKQLMLQKCIWKLHFQRFGDSLLFTSKVLGWQVKQILLILFTHVSDVFSLRSRASRPCLGARFFVDAPVAVAISGGIIGGLVSLSLRCRAVGAA